MILWHTTILHNDICLPFHSVRCLRCRADRRHPVALRRLGLVLGHSLIREDQNAFGQPVLLRGLQLCGDCLGLLQRLVLRRRTHRHSSLDFKVDRLRRLSRRFRLRLCISLNIESVLRLDVLCAPQCVSSQDVPQHLSALYYSHMILAAQNICCQVQHSAHCCCVCSGCSFTEGCLRPPIRSLRTDICQFLNDLVALWDSER
mmetsp:Transcript_103762/g.260230  ORF Transcript_103762/g.260230 Transcript_103762/m.260230 type:complete len:202 (-) Transcript_103762:376-981(-)